MIFELSVTSPTPKHFWGEFQLSWDFRGRKRMREGQKRRGKESNRPGSGGERLLEELNLNRRFLRDLACLEPGTDEEKEGKQTFIHSVVALPLVTKLHMRPRHNKTSTLAQLYPEPPRCRKRTSNILLLRRGSATHVHGQSSSVKLLQEPLNRYARDHRPNIRFRL